MASSNASKNVVYAALVGNALIAVTKFAASAMTGQALDPNMGSYMP